MQHNRSHNQLAETLQRANRIWYMALFCVILAVGLCVTQHAVFSDIGKQLPLIGLRTVGYCLAIGIFPLLRVFRGRPLQRRNDSTTDGALLSKRYCFRVLISMCGATLMLATALSLCLLGDDPASFYLIAALSLLAIVLYKPQDNEMRELLDKQSMTDQSQQ